MVYLSSLPHVKSFLFHLTSATVCLSIFWKCVYHSTIHRECRTKPPSPKMHLMRVLTTSLAHRTHGSDCKFCHETEKKRLTESYLNTLFFFPTTTLIKPPPLIRCVARLIEVHMYEIVNPWSRRWKRCSCPPLLAPARVRRLDTWTGHNLALRSPQRETQGSQFHRTRCQSCVDLQTSRVLL